MNIYPVLKNFSTLIATIVTIIGVNSCSKDEPINKQQTPESLIEESKSYFETNVAVAGNEKQTSFSKKSRNLRQFASKKPLWNEAYIKKISVGDAVVIPLAYNSTIYTKAGKNKQALSLNNLSYLMIYNTNHGGLTAELVTWVPDDEWWDGRKEKKPFTGKVIVENWRGDFVKGYKYNKNGKIEAIKSIEHKSKGNKSSVESTICIETDWYVCFSGGGYSECRYEYTEVSCTITGGGGGSGSDFWTGNPSTGSSGGGGGETNPSDYPPSGSEGTNCPPSVQSNGMTVSRAPGDCYDEIPLIPEPPLELEATELESAVLIIDERPKIEDINKYIKCFTDGKIASGYKLTMYIDQPVAGKSDRFVSIPTVVGSPLLLGGIKITTISGDYDVGHTFLGFEKINTDGSITRQVLGFYPDGQVINKKGILKDDSGRNFDVSLDISVSETQFNLALNQMKNDFDNAVYNLVNSFGRGYNCSDAAINWFNHSGTVLPNSSDGTFKNTPGELGQVLRKNPSSNQLSGDAPTGSGACD